MIFFLSSYFNLQSLTSTRLLFHFSQRAGGIGKKRRESHFNHIGHKTPFRMWQKLEQKLPVWPSCQLCLYLYSFAPSNNKSNNSQQFFHSRMNMEQDDDTQQGGINPRRKEWYLTLIPHGPLPTNHGGGGDLQLLSLLPTRLALTFPNPPKAATVKKTMTYKGCMGFVSCCFVIQTRME